MVRQHELCEIQLLIYTLRRHATLNCKTTGSKIYCLNIRENAIKTSAFTTAPVLTEDRLHDINVKNSWKDLRRVRKIISDGEGSHFFAKIEKSKKGKLGKNNKKLS